MPRPSNKEEEFDQQEANIYEEEQIAHTLAKNAPYWISSFVLHILLVILSMFWYVGLTADQQQEDVIVSVSKEPPKVIEEKKKDIDQKDVNLENKTEDPLLTDRVDDKNESPSDDQFEGVEGENLDNISDKPFKGKWANDAIGAGGGAGGAYGGPRGGLVNKRKGGGGATGIAKEAVLNALRWLARHQNADGSWDIKDYMSNCGKHSKFPGQCSPNPGTTYFKVGVTGLSILAFTGAGRTHVDKERDEETGIVFGEVVKKAINYLMKVQDEEGCIGDRTNEYLYNHLIATFALIEDYGITLSPMLKDPAEQALKYSIFAQNKGAGIRYEARSNESDSSVTGWLAQVYKSAEMAGLEVPEQAKDWIIDWYNSTTDPQYGWVGYMDNKNQDGGVIRDVNDMYKMYPSMTAIALMTRIFFQMKKDDKYVVRHATYIRSKDDNVPTWAKKEDADFYYWYYATYSMFQMGGEYWNWWKQPIEKVMIDHQNKESNCAKGSWEPEDKWACSGGRVYTTALGALILEVYYRFPNVMIEKRK